MCVGVGVSIILSVWMCVGAISAPELEIPIVPCVVEMRYA